MSKEKKKKSNKKYVFHSRDFKHPPFFSEKVTHLFMAFKKDIIFYVFCQQLINILVDELSKKNMFFSLYQPVTSLLHTITRESEQ